MSGIEVQLVSLYHKTSEIKDQKLQDKHVFEVLDLAAKYEEAKQGKNVKEMREVVDVDIPAFRKRLQKVFRKQNVVSPNQ
jgi:hypothetical protein